MGTNASNKRKVASKVLAILLATLMLLAAMPMTALAAGSSSVTPIRIVEGLTIVEPIPFRLFYFEGDALDFGSSTATYNDDLLIEVTWQASTDIAKFGQDEATRYVDVINYNDMVDYGIVCNYAEGKIMNVQDNLVPLTFNYGLEGKEELVTDIYFVVYPNDWTFARRVTNFITAPATIDNYRVNFAADLEQGDYVIVADESVAITPNKFAQQPVIGGLKVAEVLATEPVKVDGSVITSIGANLTTDNLAEITEDNVLWNINWINYDDVTGEWAYRIAWQDMISDKYLSAQTLSFATYNQAWPLTVTNPGLDYDTDISPMFDEEMGDEFYGWYLTNTNNGYMYLVDEVEYESIDAQGQRVFKTEPVKFYLATKDGYAYLTNDKTKASKISIYRRSLAQVDDIEIACNPDKMTYMEGEYFDGTGMVVNLIYNNITVVCVPYELFNQFGIVASINQSNVNYNWGYNKVPMIVKAHNDRDIVVGYLGSFDGWFRMFETAMANGDMEHTAFTNARVELHPSPIFTDDSDVKVKVIENEAREYKIPEGRLEDGKYVIAWIPELLDLGTFQKDQKFMGNGTMIDNVVYYGYGIDAEYKSYIRANYGIANPFLPALKNSTYTVSTIAGSRIESLNDTIGMYDQEWVCNKNVKESMIWNVKFDAAKRAYTFQNVSTGEYLNRKNITYKELWVGDYVLNTNGILPSDFDTDKIGYLNNDPTKTLDFNDVRNYITGGASANFDRHDVADLVVLGGKVLELGALSDASYWLVDGTIGATIQTFATNRAEENFYVVNSEIPMPAISFGEPNNAFIAASADAAFVTALAENFYFFKCEGNDIVKIEVIDQPIVRYASGDKLDLHDLVVTITRENGEVTKVPYDDLASYGLSVNFKSGDVLSVSAHNGKSVVITDGKISGSTDKLVVSDSKPAVKIVRLGGVDRYETASIIASSYAASNTNFSKSIVLANSEKFPDALAGSPLAAALNAPIVLTKNNALNSFTKKFITDNKVATAYVLGGTSAVSDKVVAELKALGVTVTRIEGADRIETSVNIAKKLAEIKGQPSEIIFANAANFPDALSVSSAAAKLGAPIIYVNSTGALSASVSSFVSASGAKKATVLGGYAAISDAVANSISGLGLSVTRVGGATRYATSTAIAEHYAGVLTGKSVTLATGLSFPDALSGGVLASLISAPVILIDNGYENADAAAYLAGRDLENVYVFGGTDALSETTVNAALLK